MRGRTLINVTVLVALFVAVGLAVLGPGLFVQNFLSALSMGSQYALIATGYSMVYGIVRLINFAHGDVFMLGAYRGALPVLLFNMPWWAAMLVSMAATGLIGAGIERVAYRPLEAGPQGEPPHHRHRRLPLPGKRGQRDLRRTEPSVQRSEQLDGASRSFDSLRRARLLPKPPVVVPLITLVALVGLTSSSNGASSGAPSERRRKTSRWRGCLAFPVIV